VLVTPVTPSYVGGIDRKIKVQASQPETRDPVPKIKQKGGGGCAAQAIEHLPGKRNTLSLNPITAKKICSLVNADIAADLRHHC
jgi:hypothetical protein